MKNLLLSLGLVAFGILVEIFTFRLVRTFGHLDWAERYLGNGGTYIAWKLIGIVAILIGFYLMRNPLI